MSRPAKPMLRSINGRQTKVATGAHETKAKDPIRRTRILACIANDAGLFIGFPAIGQRVIHALLVFAFLSRGVL